MAPFKPLNTIVLCWSEGTLNWSPMMPSNASLSDSYMSDSYIFSSLILKPIAMRKMSNKKWVNKNTLFLTLIYTGNLITHLISHSSSFSENHRNHKRRKVLERHKAAGIPTRPKMKINKAKTFKYMCQICYVPNAEPKIKTDLNFIN